MGNTRRTKIGGNPRTDINDKGQEEPNGPQDQLEDQLTDAEMSQRLYRWTRTTEERLKRLEVCVLKRKVFHNYLLIRF